MYRLSSRLKYALSLCISLVICAQAFPARAGLPFWISEDSQLHGDVLEQTVTTELDTIPDIALVAEEYSIRINFAEPENGAFPSRVEINLINQQESTLEFLELNASSDLLEISQVRIVQGETLPYTHEDDLLTIQYTMLGGSEAEIQIDYLLTPGTVNGPFGAMGLWWNGTRGYTFSFPDGAHAWVPLIDNPGSKARVLSYFGTDPSLTAVGNGELTLDSIEDDVRWQLWTENNPVCSSEMGFCIADYSIIELQTDPFPIRAYVYPADSSQAAFDFARIPQAIALFEEEFGVPYPFEELKVVECGVFNGNGGQEHQTMISLGHNMITGSRTYESILMHEIAHQWFADYITPVDWDHFWLNEGFATYSEALWAQELDGWEGYRSEIQSQRNRFLSWESTHTDALVNDNYFVTMNSPLPYERGSLALHQLRRRYGESAWRDAVQEYLTANSYGHVSSETLESCFFNETQDINLHGWFQDWVWRGEVPYICYTIDTTRNRAYVRQMETGYWAPEHGGLYNHTYVYRGYPDEHNQIVTPWPEGSRTTSVNWNLENSLLYPNFEVPARFQELDDIDSPILSVSTWTSNESIHPDRVLQPDEEMVIHVEVANAGLPLENVSWSVETLSGDMLWNGSGDEIEDIEYLQPSREMFTLNAIGGGTLLPGHGSYRLTISGDDHSQSFILTISVGTAEVLIIQDGIPSAPDSLKSALETVGIVVGVADVTIPELPDDMYGAYAIMVEADGRYAQHLFTPADEVVRDWFIEGRGSGSVTGIYMNEIYPNADPSWLGGMAGEWNQPINYSVMLGVEDDPITDGRAIVNLEPAGTTTCYPCCGTPPIMQTSDEEYVVGASLDAGWRIVNFGFSLTKLSDQSNVPMRRSELVQRIANWCLYRSTDVSPDGESELPASFEMSGYPNPFNTSHTLTFTLPESGILRVEIYNMLGQRVTLLHDHQTSAGIKKMTWQAGNQASGVYFIRSQFSNTVLQQKILLLK